MVVITLAMATEIAATRSAVWTALADPAQAAHWRPGVSGVAEGGDAPLLPGRVVSYRCQLRELPVLLRERIVTAVPEERLQSEISLGLFRFQETFRVSAPDAVRAQTRLAIRIVARSEMPVVGGSLDRFAVRRFATDLASTYLRAVRDWCERGSSASAPLPELPRAAMGAPA